MAAQIAARLNIISLLASDEFNVMIETRCSRQKIMGYNYIELENVQNGRFVTFSYALGVGGGNEVHQKDHFSYSLVF